MSSWRESLRLEPRPLHDVSLLAVAGDQDDGAAAWFFPRQKDDTRGSPVGGGINRAQAFQSVDHVRVADGQRPGPLLAVALAQQDSLRYIGPMPVATAAKISAL